MIKVVFHGDLKRFGEEFSLSVDSPAEAVKALCSQLPGLEPHIKKGSWHILRGELSEQDSVTEEALDFPFGNQREMHLIPAIEGANNGVFATIAGIALIAAGVMLGANPMLIAAGAGLLMGGIVMMTMKPPQANIDQSGPEEKASFLLSKPTNSTKQGVAVPRGYGRAIIGSIVVSSSVTAEQLLGSDESDDLSFTA